MKVCSKDFAKEFQIVLEFIDNTYDELRFTTDIKLYNEKLNTFDGTYGFYIWNANKSLGIFFGLWMDYWVDTGNPVIISLESDKEYKESDKIKFKNFINSHQDFFKNTQVFDSCYLSSVSSDIIPIVEKEIDVAPLIKDLYFILDMHQQPSDFFKIS